MQFLHEFGWKTHWTTDFIQPNLLTGEKEGQYLAEFKLFIASIWSIGQ